MSTPNDPLARLIHPAARLIDAADGSELGGEALQARVDAAAAAYQAGPPGTVLALTPTTFAGITRYLGALRAGRPVAVLDPDLPSTTLHDFVERFTPSLVVGIGTDPGATPTGYDADLDGELGQVWRRKAAPPVLPHPDLALLLTTSGSTGNPKLVRLSALAVVSNADAIASALHLTQTEIAPTTLPLFYTYGLSVLNSHLITGATVVLERQGLLHRDFWTAVNTYGITSLAAVPYQYEMLRRLRFDPARYPSLRTLTQAGGRLAPELVRDFASRMQAVGGRMYVMYGQTEATARMTVLPPDRLDEKFASVGLPVPGGRMEVQPLDDDPDGSSELVYHGPNVMMGYGERAADLAQGDQQGGALRTGDLGYVDEDGFVFVTGRLRRIGKIFGVRVNLDDVERLLAADHVAAAVADGDRLVIFVEGADDERRAAVRAQLAAALGTHSSGIDVRSIETLPLQASGKIDYRALERLR